MFEPFEYNIEYRVARWGSPVSVKKTRAVIHCLTVHPKGRAIYGDDKIRRAFKSIDEALAVMDGLDDIKVSADCVILPNGTQIRYQIIRDGVAIPTPKFWHCSANGRNGDSYGIELIRMADKPADSQYTIDQMISLNNYLAEMQVGANVTFHRDEDPARKTDPDFFPDYFKWWEVG